MCITNAYGNIMCPYLPVLIVGRSITNLFSGNCSDLAVDLGLFH